MGRQREREGAEMSEMFASYEREFGELSASIRKKTNAVIGGAAGKRAKIAEVDAEIAEADALIRRMDMEARSLAPDDKQPLLLKLRTYKSELSGMKKAAKEAASAGGDSTRSALFGDAEDPFPASDTGSQRERLLNTTARLDRTSNRLASGKQQLQETEELGADIMRSLHSQRETINHARDTLHGADDNITKSRKVLSSMARRFFQNKMIMYGIILMLVTAIALIIYFKVNGNGKS